MAFLLKDTIHRSLAETVYNEILARRSNYYYFIGKVIDWVDTNSPETPEITGDYEFDTRTGIISMKLINIRDVSYVIPRRDWETGTVYDQYDSNYSTTYTSDSGATSIKDANFYVLTSSFGVYKCLFNNNGAVSTQEPNGSDVTPVTYSDGYIWKYLYTIPLSSRNRFLTNAYMPVQRSVTNTFYSNGQISSITIDNGGSGYDANNLPTVSSIGDGANASFTAVVNLSGEVEDLVINNPGEGYTYIDIDIAGTGANANAFATLSTGDLNTIQSTVELSAVDGGIHAFKVIDGGNGYTTANVTVVGDGSGFTGTVTVTNNAVSKITVTNPGTGYTHANVTITGTNSSNANVAAIISPYGGHGYDAVKELYADTLMLYSTINNEKNQGVSVNNDYRQFGIIKNPRKFGSELSFTSSLGSCCYLVTLDSVTSLASDSVLTLLSNSEKTFEVVQIVPGSTQVLLINRENHVLAEDDILTDNTTLTNYTVTGIDAEPTINKFSGDLLFIDNRTTVSYSDQQLVTLRTVLRL